MVRQSATYARCCILSNQRRSFSISIGFQLQKLEAYVFLLHHAGLSLSRPLKVTTARGFNDLVEHIVGILSIKNDGAYGLDPTRFEDYFYINDRVYKSVEYLCVRGTLRGRSTIVHSLEVARDIPVHNMVSRRLTLSRGTETLPDKLTYKLTYQVKGQSEEGPLLSGVNGQFGIADVLGYYVCETGDPHGSTSCLLPQNGLSEGSPPESEKRGLQCIAFSADGKAFLDAGTEGGIPSPGELLETILHAIIGHYILFKKGILHRNISPGNVLRYADPIRRPALDEFDCTKYVNYCRGFLIDGDHAVRWREFSSSRSISGTRPFMSTRLVGASEDAGQVIHTALDDLESFLWLLMWGIVEATVKIDGAMDANKGLKRMRRAFSSKFAENDNRFQSARLDFKDAVFGDLIQEWLDIFQKTHDYNKKFTQDISTMQLNDKQRENKCDRLEKYTKNIYKRVLESGFRHLDEVKDYPDWDRVVNANARKFLRKQFDEDEYEEDEYEEDG